MKRFIGLDVHKTVVEVCAVNEAGQRLFRRRIDCTREVLLDFGVEHTEDDSLALEVTTNAWAVADVLEPFVGRVVVSNPMKTRAIAEAKVKTDKVDAEVLAQLLRCDYLPSVWVTDATTGSLRQLTSRRERLVSERTRLKNRIQSVLAGMLVPDPVKTLFSEVRQQWLTDCELPADQQALINSDVRLIVAVDKEIEVLETGCIGRNVDRFRRHVCDIGLLWFGWLASASRMFSSVGSRLGCRRAVGESRRRWGVSRISPFLSREC